MPSLLGRPIQSPPRHATAASPVSCLAARLRTTAQQLPLPFIRDDRPTAGALPLLAKVKPARAPPATVLLGNSAAPLRTVMSHTAPTMVPSAPAVPAEPSSLPVVDLARYSSVEALGNELLRVGRYPGFFYVTGHHLDDTAAERMFALARSFFERPTQEKEEHANGSGDLGYTGMGEESLGGTGRGDIKESFYLADPGRPDQKLPRELEAGRAEMAQFFDDSMTLAKRLLEALAAGLGMPKDFLANAHNGESCRMRLLKYPPVEMTPPPGEDETPDIRAGEHSDYGSLTLLFRQPSDQGGLQVLMADGESNDQEQWVDVPCLKDAIVVNIGDALEFWTAGKLRSTVHRVAYPRSARENVARMSIPVFIQPDRAVVLEPHAMQRGEGGEKDDALSPEFLEVLRRKGYASAKAVTSWEHLSNRIHATYRKA